MTKQADRRYKYQLGIVSNKAKSNTIANMRKTADSQPDFRLATETNEIDTSWTCKSESSNKGYGSLSIAVPEFGPKKLYANLGRAAGSDNENLSLRSGILATKTDKTKRS